jgi:peptidoglycan/LPS O-acetylase OafA/YrhL
VLPQVVVAFARLTGRPTPWPTFPADPGAWLTHLTFTHLFFHDWWGSINGSLWTMSLEMQLYLLFPVLVLALGRWGLRVLAAAVVVSVAYRVIVSAVVPGPALPDEFTWAASGPGRLMELTAGMLAADIAFRRVWRPTRRAKVLLVAVIPMLFLAASTGVATATWLPLRELLLSGLFVSLLLLATTSTRVSHGLAVAPLSHAGYRAYSLFLVHQPLMFVLSLGVTELGWLRPGVALLAMLWTVGLGLTLLVGEAFFRLVERPCIAWSRRARPAASSDTAGTTAGTTARGPAAGTPSDGVADGRARAAATG